MSEEDNPLEFSAKDLMPDWAQETSKPQKPRDKPARRDDGDQQKDDRRGGGGGRDFRGRGGSQQGGPGGGRDNSRGRGGGGGYDGDRRGGGGGGDRRGGGGDRRGGDRRGGDRGGGRGGRFDRREDDRPRHEPPAPGVTASIEPSDPAVRGLVKHIKESFRTFPLADLAKMILHSRDRYQVRFRAAEDGGKFYQCQGDSSLWLTREEAVSHLLTSEAIGQYYTVEEVDTGAPAGNFNVVAVCGMSGVILGPPNHHEYQRNVARLHAERFSNMALERFKSRVVMEKDEEVIEKWKQEVSRVKHYRLKTDESPEPEVAVEAEPAVEAVPEEVEADAVEEIVEVDAEETPVEEVEAAASEEPEGEQEQDQESAVEEPVPVEESVVLKTPEELAMHFRKNFAGDVIVEVRQAVVSGNIPANNLSRGLLEHLKQESEALRRGFPLPMIQALCRAFEKHNLKFFKRGKKSLHVSAVRPKALDKSVPLSDAIKQLVDYVSEHPRCLVVDMLDALADDFTKPEKGAAVTEELALSDGARVILSNLRWLASEGLILEFPDTRLVLGRTDPPAKKAAPKKKKAEAKPKSVEPPAPAPSSEVSPKEETEPASSSEVLTKGEAEPASSSEVSPKEETEPEVEGEKGPAVEEKAPSDEKE